MKLTKTSAQAVLALAFLHERQSDGVTQARQVAEHLAIPTESVLKILQLLTRQKLIESRLGRSGGYRLHRDADSITLLDVVEAIDGPIGGQVPLHDTQPHIARSKQLLSTICDQAAGHIRAELARVTIADLHRSTHEDALAAAG